MPKCTVNYCGVTCFPLSSSLKNKNGLIWLWLLWSARSSLTLRVFLAACLQLLTSVMLSSAKGFRVRRVQSSCQYGNKTERTGIQSDTDFSEAQIRSRKAQTLKLHLPFWHTGMYMLNIVNTCPYSVFRLPTCCVWNTGWWFTCWAFLPKTPTLVPWSTGALLQRGLHWGKLHRTPLKAWTGHQLGTNDQ